MALLITVVHMTAAIVLAVYGLNALLLTFLYLRHRRCTPSEPLLHRSPRVFDQGERGSVRDLRPLQDRSSQDRWPLLATTPGVTVQLPVYNERHVVVRLIDAVARLAWPRECLEIQILDDSTDETTAIARAIARRWRRRGINVRVIHRDDRSGFKAGALAHGLGVACGEFIAVFDADFVPSPDFLWCTIPHLLADPEVGMVQVRWGHLNADYSPLTRAQALAIDGHFVIEQAARVRNGLFLSFNGSAGVWRRRCIESVGGWQTDTLAEDVDLSYRAQLAGWRLHYLPHVIAPAELPPQIHAFKAQQFRWAKGSIQVVRKLARSLLTADAPAFVRLQGVLHLTGYLAHPLMVILLLTLVPRIAMGSQGPAVLTYLTLATLGPPMLYTVSQRESYPDWRRRLLSLPLLALIGVGIALSNTQAVAEAWLGRPTPFRRTPKFRVEKRTDRWTDSSYALGFDPLVLGELGLAAYASVGIALAWIHDQWMAIPFLLLYALGFGVVALLTILHSRPAAQSFRRSLALGRSVER